MPRSSNHHYRDRVDAGQLAAAAEVVHARALRAQHGEAEVASSYSGFTLAGLLADLSRDVSVLPAGLRDTAVRRAERLCRDDEPPRERAGITGI